LPEESLGKRALILIVSVFPITLVFIVDLSVESGSYILYMAVESVFSGLSLSLSKITPIPSLYVGKIVPPSADVKSTANCSFGSFISSS